MLNHLPSIETLLSMFNDDMEQDEVDKLVKIIQTFMESLYPPFEPEIIHSISGKDYYLPALKVLHKIDGEFFSPSFNGKWTNKELVATCSANQSYRLVMRYLEHELPNEHESPNDECDCGIYGTVNLEEVQSYLFLPPTFDKRVLCVIEPSIGAKVHLARKGWKASKAFISEIVGETISVEDTSNLLSLAWHRNLDIRKVYNEDR